MGNYHNNIILSFHLLDRNHHHKATTTLGLCLPVDRTNKLHHIVQLSSQLECMRVLSERIKIIKDLKKEKAIYRQLLIKDLCIHFGEEEDTEEDIIERERSFALFDTKELEDLLQDSYDNEPELLSPESLSNSSSTNNTSNLPVENSVTQTNLSIPMTTNNASSNSSSSSDHTNGEEVGPALLTTPEEKAEYEAERQQLLTLISAHDPSLAQTLARLVTGRVNLILEFERISGHKYKKVLPFPTSIQSQASAAPAAASTTEEQVNKTSPDKIINSDTDNFGKSTGEEETTVEAGSKNKNNKPRPRPLSALPPAPAAPSLSSSSSYGQAPHYLAPPPLPQEKTPLSLLRANKRRRGDSEDDDDDDDDGDQSEDLTPAGSKPVPGADPPKKGATKPSAAQNKAAASAASAKKSKGSAGAAAVAGDNPGVPGWLKAKRIQDTLALSDKIKKEHVIESAAELRYPPTPRTDKFKCEMCLYDKINNGFATSICIGCSYLSPPQRLHYICWDHALQHGMDEFKAQYCTQCFQEFQEDGHI